MALTDKVVVIAHERRESEAVLDALKLVGVPGDRLLPLYTEDGPVDAAAAVAQATGLVLAGGGDLDPAYYQETPLPGVQISVQPGRDEAEWALLAGARDAHLPVWAICRGMQMLNVFLGGDLWQDLPTQVAGSVMHQLAHPRDALVHRVEVLPAGRETGLGELLARETALVNSRHQGVRRLGAELVPVAAAPDGLLEAVVLDSDAWWVEAVEWHPENLMPMPQQRALAHRFLDAMTAYQQRRHALDPHAEHPHPSHPATPAGAGAGS
jgi:putative glutamine amidotransferase